MPITYERLLELREEAFADDVEIDAENMAMWTEAQAMTFFESGGLDEPSVCADLANLSIAGDQGQNLATQAASDHELDSARSSVDGWVAGGRGGTSVAPTVPYADLAAGEDEAIGAEMVDEDGDMDGSLFAHRAMGIGLPMAVEMIEDNLEAGGEERTEDALLDEDPMASVPVTRPSAPPPPAYAANYPEAEDDGVSGWSIRQLKDFVVSHGGDASGFAEKREFIEEVRQLRRQQTGVQKGAGTAGTPSTGVPTPPPAAPSAKLARLIRKVEDIKSTGDGAFRNKDFEKADGHYTSALQRAAESTEPLPATLLSALFSNRAGTRSMLSRHHEALEDGRMALKHRPSWARAFSRIGAALIELHRYDEAKANYEQGLRVDPGSAELQRGLTDVLGRLGKSAGGSEVAAKAKQSGNEAFKEGRMAEAYTAYSEAIRAAPSDETLYSNRSAVLAKLERYDEALADGKRAVSLQPGWGKAYSRAGLAALKGRDEESAYWFYSNGLKKEAANAELLRGRDSTLQALMSAQSARHKRRVERFLRDAERAPARVFAVSDVHYDHPGAKEWAANLSKTAYKDDAIIVAGDVGDTYQAVRLCLRAFRAAFRRVFYVPGNHDMWIRPQGQHSNEPSMFADSVQKLLSLWQMCDENDIDVGPARLSQHCTVVPLDSWYSCTFDHHDPRPGSTLFDKFCKWPMHYDNVWEFMTGINEPRMQIVEKHTTAGQTPDVITFSHFLPRKELPLPGVYEMAKASGCLKVEEQLRRLNSRMHIFGHTHINTQNDLNGVTYMQNAMGYGISPGTKLCVVHDKGRFTTYMA